VDDDKATVLDRNARFEGKLEGSNITLRGRFKGNLRASGVLRIVDGSDIEAKIKANRVEIDGRFQGEVQADSLQLWRSVSPPTIARPVLTRNLDHHIGVPPHPTMDGSYR
jgi:cytoskeletal protein CcmA (bactofilin family)